MSSHRDRVHVVAGVIEDDRRRVLVSRRPPGRMMAGAWEFPGGKLCPGEEALDGLIRELDEELGIRVEGARPLIRYRHRYPELDVDLDVWRVNRWSGKPEGREGQAFAWHPPEALLGIGLLPADAAVVSAIRLPSILRVTPPDAPLGETAFLDTLANTAPDGLICLRRPDLEPAAYLDLAFKAARHVAASGLKLVLHGDPAVLSPALRDDAGPLSPLNARAISGLHVPARYLVALNERPVPASLWFGCSCHDARELEAALALGADYAFLGPVRPTASHPDAPAIGWEGFSALVAGLPLPVYAIGGLSAEDLDAAWSAGAHGIAGIRGLWLAPDGG